MIAKLKLRLILFGWVAFLVFGCAQNKMHEPAPIKPKKSKKRLVVLMVIAALAGGLGYAYQQGMLPV